MANEFKSGFVSIIGRPNVGKSTLMNYLVGEKIAIVSNRPQTTRNKIRSILTGENYQIIFIDTPGIHKPKTKLGDFMVKSAKDALSGVDIILLLIEPKETGSDDILAALPKNANVILVINKSDTVKKPEILVTIDKYAQKYPFTEVIPISALTGENTDDLLNCLTKYLPQGPKYFPDDMITDQPERQITAEIIREKGLKYMQDEIPHGLAVEIVSMKKRAKSEMVDIEATVYCERDSHKSIVIGKGGAMLKKIGASARRDLERLLGSPINLQLWVKVRKHWRDNDMILNSLGYNSKHI